MSFVDAFFERDKDKISVVERVNGERVYKEYPASYLFYYDDPKGKFRSIYNTPVSRFSTRSNKEFQKEMRMHGRKGIYEGDINPVVRCLEDNYKGVESPNLHIAFFDIEVAMQPFAVPSDTMVKIRKKKR